MSPAHKVKIQSLPADWIMTNSSSEENLLALFRNQNSPDLVLSLRVDKLERFPSKKPSLVKYIRYYTKKYPRAGLEIINNPKKSIFGHYAKVNLVHKDKDTGSQQTILWHPDNKAFIFTCSGKRENLQRYTKMCSDIISRLKWL